MVQSIYSNPPACDVLRARILRTSVLRGKTKFPNSHHQLKTPVNQHHRYTDAPACRRSLRRVQCRAENGMSRHEEEASGLSPGSPLPLVLPENGQMPYSEASRRYRRTVYKHEDWLEHRSSTRIFRNLQGLFTSGVVRSLLAEVATVTSASAFVVVWNSIAGGYTDLSNEWHASPLGDGQVLSGLLLHLPALPFTLASPALGLLLVFRTNTSYARWLEARGAWGRVVSHLKNLQRQSSTWLDKQCTGPERREALDKIRRASWAVSCALCAHLGGPEEEASLISDVRSRLPADEADLLLSAKHRPLRALSQLSRALDAMPIDEKKRVEMDKSIIIVGDALEVCERIFTNPVPLVYTRHTARFLAMWLLLLPMGLWEPFSETWNHIGMIPGATMAAIFMFGIEELAVQLEEPFSILPLSDLCEGVWEAADDLYDPEELSSPHHNGVATRVGLADAAADA